MEERRKRVEEIISCSICLEPFSPTDDNSIIPVLLTCGHTFHRKCLSDIVGYYVNEIECPICSARTLGPTQSLHPNYILLDLLTYLKEEKKVSEVLCDECDKEGLLICFQCKLYFCVDCDNAIHLHKVFQKHKRVPILSHMFRNPEKRVEVPLGNTQRKETYGDMTTNSPSTTIKPTSMEKPSSTFEEEEVDDIDFDFELWGADSVLDKSKIKVVPSTKETQTTTEKVSTTQQTTTTSPSTTMKLTSMKILTSTSKKVVPSTKEAQTTTEKVSTTQLTTSPSTTIVKPTSMEKPSSTFEDVTPSVEKTIKEKPTIKKKCAVCFVELNPGTNCGQRQVKKPNSLCYLCAQKKENFDNKKS